MAEYQDAVISWPANEELGIEDFELTIPYRSAGRVEIWKCPICAKYPNGYYVALSTNTAKWFSLEPGCESWRKTRLARILVYDQLMDEDTWHVPQNTVEYIHPSLKDTIDTSMLNPNKELHAEIIKSRMPEVDESAASDVTEEVTTVISEDGETVTIVTTNKEGE